MTSHRRRLPVVAGVALLAIVMTACSIDPEGSPRDIAVRDRRDLRSNFVQQAGAATGAGRIFLLSPEVLGQPPTLQSVAREVGVATATANMAQFKVPNKDEG